MAEHHSRSVERLAAARALRMEVLDMATRARRDPGSTHVLWLIEPRMTTGRIAEEWRELCGLLRPELTERLSVGVVGPDGRVTSLGAAPPGPRSAPPVSREGPPRGGALLPAPDFGFVIRKLLLYAWVTGRGPVTTRWLAATAGCSYPTALAAVHGLEPLLVRARSRKVELRRFPREEWARLLATAEVARSTLRFADRSGQPRTLESLVRRLEELGSEGVALGGVLGARQHDPEIDLVGLPRLDLSVHSPGRRPDVSFVHRLDPALEPTLDPREPARLVVHFVRHKQPLFDRGQGVLPRADVVECLLDLHEARLEPQAAELLQGLVARREAVGRARP